MKFIPLIWSFLLDAVKAFFGTDKLEEHKVIHEPSKVPVDDESLIADLRRVHQDRAERESNVPDSGTGKAGEDSQEDRDHDST